MKWEFPGGKQNIDETETNCIIREIKEELNIEIVPIRRMTPVVHRYSDIEIELIPYFVRYTSGEISLQEHAKYAFLSADQLNTLDWAEADLPIVKQAISL